MKFSTKIDRSDSPLLLKGGRGILISLITLLIIFSLPGCTTLKKTIDKVFHTQHLVKDSTGHTKKDSSGSTHTTITTGFDTLVDFVPDTAFAGGDLVDVTEGKDIVGNNKTISLRVHYNPHTHRLTGTAIAHPPPAHVLATKTITIDQTAQVKTDTKATTHENLHQKDMTLKEQIEKKTGLAWYWWGLIIVTVVGLGYYLLRKWLM